MQRLFFHHLAILLLFLTGPAGRVQAQDRPQGQPQEIFLEFRFSSANTIINAYLYRDTIYLPIGELFTALKIDHTVSIDKRTVAGTYLDLESSFHIDLAQHTAEYRSKQTPISDSEVLVTDANIFLTPRLYFEIFKMKFLPDLSNLSLALESPYPMPIEEEFQRELRRKSLAVPFAVRPFAPLLFTPQRAFFDGGFLDYNVVAAFNPQNQSITSQLRGGSELLGGGLEIEYLGSIINQRSPSSAALARWNYIFEPNKLLTEVNIGNLSSGGLNQHQYRGIALSNEPTEIRRFFAFYQIEKILSPGWDVELFLNNQLVSFAKLDSAGKYATEIPLGYGSNQLELRYFGLKGERGVETRRIDIPMSLLPARELIYALSLGEVSYSGTRMAQGNLMYGLTDFLTTTVGVDYLSETKFSKPIFYQMLSSRFWTSYLVNLEYASSLRYGGRLRAIYQSNAGFEVSYLNYLHNLYYNPADRTSEINASGFFPTMIAGIPFNYRITGNLTKFERFSQYQYNIDVSSAFYPWYLGAGLQRYANRGISDRWFGTSSIRTFAIYSVSSQAGAFEFLNGAIINGTADFSVSTGTLERMSIDGAQSFLPHGRIRLSLDHDFRLHSSGFFLLLTFDLPTTYYTTSVSAAHTNASLYHTFNGTIGYDSNHGELLFHNRGGVGRSAATFLMYVDANGDGQFNQGEQILPDVNFNLSQSVVIDKYPSGMTRVRELLPYNRYNVEISDASEENPLIVPSVKAFSFLTPPNRYLPIDFPFYTSAIFEGTIQRSRGGQFLPVPGLNVHIRGAKEFHKEILTFSNGSFYYMGVPPGEYIVSPDSAQLRILNVTADPPQRTITIGFGGEGQFFTSLDFILSDRGETKRIPEGEAKR
ncbi:MAG: hypothetical protein V1799_13655 [bacterium]